MTEKRSQRRRDELIRHPRPLPKEDAEELVRCEDVLSAGVKDFLRIGEALSTIHERNLYRKDFQSFSDYCRDKWGLARRTAYQRLAVYQVYENIREAYADDEITADTLPANEYQLRQLLPLHTPELQRQAWQRALSLWEEESDHTGKITAEIVKKAVMLTQNMHQTSRLQPLIASTQFSMIPLQLELCHSIPGTQQPTMTMDAQSLAKHLQQTGATETLQAPSVLVNPQIDLFAYTRLYPALQHVIQACAMVEQYRFVFWTTNYHCLQEFRFWHANTELAIRVSNQSQVDEFAIYWQSSRVRPPLAIWIDAAERVTLPTHLELTRLLISVPDTPNGYDEDRLADFRHSLTAILQTAWPVHVDASVRARLAMLVTSMDEAVQPKVSKNILREMYGDA